MADISLNFAAVSALFYVYELYVFKAWELTALNIFITLAYVPVAILQYKYIQKRLKGERLIK